MGSAVNGPGTSREADPGVSRGSGKGQSPVRGQVVHTVVNGRIVGPLLDEAVKLCAAEGPAKEMAGAPAKQPLQPSHSPVRS